MLDAHSEGHEGNEVQVVRVRVRIPNEVHGRGRPLGPTVVPMEFVSCSSYVADHSCILLWLQTSLYRREGTVVPLENIWSW